MVRLWLSSYRIGQADIALRDFVGGTGRTALVYNACDVYPRGEIWNDYQRGELDRLRSADLDPFVLDLTEFRGNSGGVRQALRF